MAQPNYNSSETLRQTEPRTLRAGYLFGVPVKDMGWFATLLMGFATGFLGFFASTFVAILSILGWNSTGHRPVDYAYSYSRVGLPTGLLCGALALGYLGMLWVRRQAGRG